jgi:hypothetical protein
MRHLQRQVPDVQPGTASAPEAGEEGPTMTTAFLIGFGCGVIVGGLGVWLR